MNKFERISIVVFCLILAGFIFLSWVASAAFAQQPNQHTKENFCKSIIQIHENLDALMEDVPHSSKILRGLDARRFVDAFNSFGQKTNIKADSVGFYVSNATPGSVFVTFEENHCVKDKGFMPVKVYVELMRQSTNTTGGA